MFTRIIKKVTTLKPYQLWVYGILLAGCSGCLPSGTARKKTPVTSPEYWLTSPTQHIFFEPQPFPAFNQEKHTLHIRLNEAQTYQSMEGFGYTLTGGSALLLSQLPAVTRQQLLQELFGTRGSALGVSYLRLSIGASDLSERVFTYDDLPDGQTDPTLAQFSLEPDRQYLIPVLKEILAINPALKLMGTPWTPPVWMKTNGQSKGGSLKPEWYTAYARYLVKYIQAMKQEGIAIDAITIQNEPLHPGNNPSLLMLAEEQAAFLKRSLGPAFRQAGLRTKLLIYDHNADHPEYPLTILNDPEARQYVDGTAFHLYGGSIEALNEVHSAYPDKAIYFTEQWVGAPGHMAGDIRWHVKNLMIGAPRNWARTVLEWNLASDPHQRPHTEGGCTQCLGAITIDSTARITRNPAYYIIAHASRNVRPGSVRIGSDGPSMLPNVAFKTPGGQLVLIVLNDSVDSQTFSVEASKKHFSATIAAGAVATYVW